MTCKRPRAKQLCPQRCPPVFPKLTKSTKVDLLALPDEPLSLILYHLGACDTGGSFQGPRHAFILAQTNTRLLRLFTNLLTRITPDTSNPTPPALSPFHLLAVARLAGNALRELHLPDGCFDILPYVARACPRIEALSVVDNPLRRKNELDDVLRILPLRSLTIDNPSFECFRLLESPPPELTLNNVLYLCLLELIPILRNPPRKLNLMVDYKGFTIKPWLTKLLSSLEEAIPKMESVSLKMPFLVWHPREDFSDEATRLISRVRENDTESTCMSIKLEGDGIFQLLNSVHPKAEVEITRWGQTFAEYGDGFHAQVLVIGRTYTETDISRLKSVIVTERCNTKWKTALSGVKLERLKVYDVAAAADMGVSFDTVELRVALFRGSEWGWLANAREVRIGGVVGHCPTSGWVLFFEALASMLQQSHARLVWVRDISLNQFAPTRAEIPAFRRAVRWAGAAVDRFEERGGDAGTVKALTENVLSLGLMQE